MTVWLIGVIVAAAGGVGGMIAAVLSEDKGIRQAEEGDRRRPFICEAAPNQNMMIPQRGHCQWGCFTAAISDRRGLDLLGAREV